MTAKLIQFQPESLISLLAGIDTLANTVKTTLGPRGQNVVLGQQSAPPVITQNGNSIANFLELPDPMENLGVQILKKVANITGDVSGDGTTTAIVLTQSIINSGIKSIDSGASASDIKIGLNKALDAVLFHLQSQSNLINTTEEIKQITAIATNNDAVLTDLIISGLNRVGKNGTILVDNSNSRKSSVEIESGMDLDRVPVHEVESETLQDRVLILLTDEEIRDMDQVNHILALLNRSQRHLILIASSFSEHMLMRLDAINSRKSKTIAAIQAPGFGDQRYEILRDIALFSGATVISKKTGLTLESVGIGELGIANRIFFNKYSTTLVDGGGDERNVDSRIHQIKFMLEQTTDDHLREDLQQRLANLIGSVAIILVGGDNEKDMIQRKMTVQNAIISIKAAIDEGVVPGGGVAIIRAQQELDKLKNQEPDFIPGIEILRKALESTLFAIAVNADEDPEFVVKKVQDGHGSFGFNAQSRKYEDLEKVGILDPLKVIRTALENAVNYSSLVLSTNVCITDQL